MAEKKVYKIRIPGALVEVTEEVYLAYYRMARCERAQQERDTYNGTVSYDAMDTEELLGEELLPSQNTVSVEDAVITNILRDNLHRCLVQLPKAEQDLLYALFFEGLSERQFAKATGSHYMTLHNQKVRVLRKLRKMMER